MPPEVQDFTIGAEEEFLLVDPESRRLVPAADRVVAADNDAGEAEVGHELQLSQLETGTAVCDTLGELRTELVRLRRSSAAAAEGAGYRIAAAGTHPISVIEGSRFTPEPAYLRLERDYQLVAREQVVCGCHVHIGISDRDVAIDVMNRVRPWLAPIAALAANSPYWMGEDTGYASFRSEIWRRWPMSGTPEPLASRAEYDRLVEELLATGAIDAPARIYWDVRPSAKFETLEFRVTDACSTVDETVMVAGLVRGLARAAWDEAKAGEPPVVPRAELLRAATWRAARFGLDGELIDLGACRSVPARELVDTLTARLRPALEDLGDWDEVTAHVDAVFGRGTGATRQRHAFSRAGRLEDVVDFLLAQTAPGGPGD
ncbi:MAG TPA: glutamate--cysteine ligase [Acidimicrobiales bacterium]|nr:glutamate--cysteine ligase [Acidimicrobiales bacterium]